MHFIILKLIKPNMHDKMWLRRRFCKRVLFIVLLFVLSFYISLILFGDWQTPRVIRLTDLNRCPACYGVSVCPELYSNHVILDRHSWTSLFNAKNIFYGYTKTNRRVVLKKLAHDWEFREFDEKLCKSFNLKKNCKPIHLLNVTDIGNKYMDIVRYNYTWPSTEVKKGIVMCPYAQSIYDLLSPVLDKQRQHEMINVWTMLSINPEPIILQVLSRKNGWPVPLYGGVCGRLEIVSHEGEPLATMAEIPWHRKLKHAKKILNAAMDFTFKHDRFRFYLMDWSLDNIVANDQDEITFIDLEDFVVLDKHITPKRDLPHWYQRYSRESIGHGFTFSIENMCRHHLSDHNIWAACYILAGPEDPYLFPIPKKVNTSRPHFYSLLKECLDGDERFKTVTKLQHVIDDLLMDENIVGFGNVVR